MHLLRLLVWLLPPSRLKNTLLSWTPGWQVHRTARLAPCLVWRVDRASIGSGAVVGIGNMFREVARLELGAHSALGQLNWFSAAARWIPTDHPDEQGLLRLDPHSSISSRHYVDVSGGLRLGPFSTIGGVRSTVLTHSVEVRDNVLRAAPVHLGAYSLVLTNAVLVPGSSLGDRVVVAASAVVTGALTQPETLYGGVPAKPVASLAGAKYFDREQTGILSDAEMARLLQELMDRSAGSR